MTSHPRINRYTNLLPTVMTIVFATLTTFGTLKADTTTVTTASTTKDINVLSSIKPIQLITTAIVGDLGQSNLLLPPSANPHHYQLRPSQRTRLNQADLFVWVGPELELFLVKVLKVSSVKQLALTKALKLNTRPAEESEEDHHDGHGHHAADTHGHSSSEHGGSFDPHIWLDPAFTQQIAEAIYEQLILQHPQSQPPLKLNLERFLSRLKSTEQAIKNQLNTQNKVATYTFHQAFTHFADHYGLEISGIITPTPEARPGAKHLSQLTREISQKKKICLVKEPNFKAPYVDSITKGTDVILTIADPLATDIDNSETGYFEFIKAIADSFTKCSQ
ncbi:zinc ABC transporter substrate-binding protein [Alkalimarinus alittae]|uniref:High-affinity zinc uptake system protein ZnuA n=1 Tax=Alkalimarinus alittae TaxID=2961619 RepID=A0ABY6MY16_9ALTE|nr:zinc ABC transporter substrate-binding protein [Alkalimarinus alittae]UZE94726.1 zinc ABC transporter substrate-binding protein [Alkalimarinus alittae]